MGREVLRLSSGVAASEGFTEEDGFGDVIPAGCGVRESADMAAPGDVVEGGEPVERREVERERAVFVGEVGGGEIGRGDVRGEGCEGAIDGLS